MFYSMINRARDKWYSSPECTVNDLISHMINRGGLRDAQIEAIKTYLFLKIACEGKPLDILFSSGKFNSIDLDNEPLSRAAREYLSLHSEAAALYEFASQKNAQGKLTSEKIINKIQTAPDTIDYINYFHSAFYGVNYADYLFSLPMGAGKTYLMAAFIYLDLYFAANEPSNPAFAHNFMLMAPSGLKSSVIPSLRTVQNFDPTWVLPEPAASNTKRCISFEILDENKSASKSNRTRNPNVQKLALYQPYDSMFGLVAVTNAEKVILDRIQELNGQVTFDTEDEDKLRLANELRSTIKHIPSLAIFIDEVHHAVSDEIKLRNVVNDWAASGNVNSVIGFSGTPYLAKAEKTTVGDVTIACSEIANIVYYYRLIDGIGNFLKRPTVKIANIADSSEIVELGVRTFLDQYKDTVYEGGLTAKLGIYCGTIPKLETVILPLVSRIVAEYGLSADVILKYHKGNKEYPQPASSQLAFETLDRPFSNVRIILLVQIGKEGWDCRSLTGVILSQEGDCPKNMVLQTSCRCLRQVTKGEPETALIYLNHDNAEKLKEQLQKEHHTTIEEFANKEIPTGTILNRYDRTNLLKVPPINCYQLRVSYNELVIDEDAHTEERIKAAADGARISGGTILSTDFTMQISSTDNADAEKGDELATFLGWLVRITKGGFNTITIGDLLAHKDALKDIFTLITYEADHVRFFSSHYDCDTIEANIRKAFCVSRTFEMREEQIKHTASLLIVNKLTTEVTTSKPDEYYPHQDIVNKIHQADEGQLVIPEQSRQIVELFHSMGRHADAEAELSRFAAPDWRHRSYHYLPYHTDSGFERTFLEQILPMEMLKDKGLELYFNGDDTLTEFQISCYAKSGKSWNSIGKYVPDFLIIKRNGNDIHQVMVIETKGRIYASDPKFIAKRQFAENWFMPMNNQIFGYNRFEYLYLEDTMPDWEQRLIQSVTTFFEVTE